MTNNRSVVVLHLLLALGMLIVGGCMLTARENHRSPTTKQVETVADVVAVAGTVAAAAAPVLPPPYSAIALLVSSVANVAAAGLHSQAKKKINAGDQPK